MAVPPPTLAFAPGMAWTAARTRSTVAAAAATPLAGEARADTESNDEKRKARYQANSPEVQTFYRVNRYPS